MFPDKLRVSSFPDRFPHSAWTAASSAHSDSNGSRVYACLGVTCHLHFWQNDRGLLRATAVIRGWNGHRTRVSTQSCEINSQRDNKNTLTVRLTDTQIDNDLHFAFKNCPVLGVTSRGYYYFPLLVFCLVYAKHSVRIFEKSIYKQKWKKKKKTSRVITK